MHVWCCISVLLLATVFFMESESRSFDHRILQLTKADKQPRYPRGFKDMRLGIARGFGKRSCCQYETGISYGFGKRGEQQEEEVADSFSTAHSKRKKTDSFSVKWFTNELAQNPTLTRAVLQNLVEIGSNSNNFRDDSSSETIRTQK